MYRYCWFCFSVLHGEASSLLQTIHSLMSRHKEPGIRDFKNSTGCCEEQFQISFVSFYCFALRLTAWSRRSVLETELIWPQRNNLYWESKYPGVINEQNSWECFVILLFACVISIQTWFCACPWRSCRNNMSRRGTDTFSVRSGECQGVL